MVSLDTCMSNLISPNVSIYLNPFNIGFKTFFFCYYYYSYFFTYSELYPTISLNEIVRNLCDLDCLFEIDEEKDYFFKGL